MQSCDQIRSDQIREKYLKHAITLHECKVFDRLLCDGGGACGTASSVSKVPGNVKLPGPVDCNKAHKSHALSVTVMLFGLLSRTPTTHCISHAEKKLEYKFLWHAATPFIKAGKIKMTEAKIDKMLVHTWN